MELGSDDVSSGSTIARATLWKDLLSELVERASSGTAAERPLANEAAGQIAAAIRLQDASAALPESVKANAEKLANDFRGHPFRARPIGFYTWTPALEGIFRRDRFLQSPFEVAPTFGAFAATAVALNGSPGLRDRYVRTLDLFAGLTNPSYDRSIRDLFAIAQSPQSLTNLASLETAFAEAHPETQGTAACRAGLAFAPASDSPETRLFRNLYCDAPPSAETTLIDVLIAKIRAGELDLTPTAESGFYDRQLHALETLLVPDSAPEKDHLFLTKRYKEKLIETFKTIITQNRETHVKQLGPSMSETSATVEPVNLYPLLPVEPFPTFYLRTARAYAFLEGLLRSTMGEGFLAQASRIVESGHPLGTPLGEELNDRICILYGLHELASASIGMRSQMSDEEIAAHDPAQCQERASDWLRGWMWDRDIERDPRVIVPMHLDLQSRTIRYWAVIGVQALRMEASFYPGHEPKIVKQTCGFESWVARDSFLLVGKQVEVTLPDHVPPPTRDELRAICDRHDTAAAIVAELERR